ncbi:MAG: class I SAM-dependent methyltransferase [Sinobacteraceae bacterium]|nr:class I SAM-dependent methyltransferase [Nevskiaceae bacterium]MBV9316975.1 class I SAM-dependent methyltransferase [Gammaproteobacteria bacterium]
MSTPRVGPGTFLEQALRCWQSILDRRRRSDGLLQPAQTWEAQYAAGRWDFLAQLPELARFSVLAGYIGHLQPGGAVLDSGCGQGLLLRRLPGDAYSRYVGLDVSASAIAVAQKQRSARSTFLVADCEDYLPAEPFDVMVFNEVLCCLRDPLRTVERYTRSLTPGGLVLVSLCTAARGSATILWQLKRVFATVDEVRLHHSARKVSWVCAALRPEG